MVYKSKVDIVHESLLDAIVNGELKQGERLKISHIAKQFEVSEIPVREALRRLESEGYVKINANQGAVVDGIDKVSLASVFQIKAVLEGYATRLSIDHITKEEIQELKDLNEKMLAADEKDGPSPSEINVLFHLKIYESIPNKELVEMIQNMWKKWRITKNVFKLSSVNVEQSYKEHEEIIKCLEEHDYTSIEELVRRHKLRAGANLISSMESRGTDGNNK